jgi:hypothetical protein
VSDETAQQIGRGAVLYDDREPGRRQCCSRGGRCLAHVRGVYAETATGEVYYDVECGTHTTQQWVHEDDLLALYTPAGWSVATHHKPTHILTREHGVDDHHDLMQKA